MSLAPESGGRTLQEVPVEHCQGMLRLEQVDVPQGQQAKTASGRILKENIGVGRSAKLNAEDGGCFSTSPVQEIFYDDGTGTYLLKTRNSTYRLLREQGGDLEHPAS